jgi:hypothetical protein
VTDPGLPFAGGAPACPFVAFDHDRDERATSPDHRHRCYAETPPAPRALAHQEAYCLASAFPVCPTFQDWARREAARTREGAAPSEPRRAVPVAEPPAGAGRAPDDAPERDPRDPYLDDQPQRVPQRDWAAPPPWAADGGEAPPEWGGPTDAYGDPAVTGQADAAGDPGARGLSGSVADRFAGAPPPERPVERSQPAPPDARDYDDDDTDALEDDEEDEPGSTARAAGGLGAIFGDRRPRVGDTRPRRAERESIAPTWERPRRMEAYPTLRPRMSVPRLSPLIIAAVAVGLAAVARFFLPQFFLGDSGGDGTATATPSAAASATATAAPTPTPAPTPTVYVVQPGDTLSKIATQFGLTLPQVLDANPQITDPDAIQIGDPITIPEALPSSFGGSPSPSTAP